MKKNEIIELNGVEYTLELNRESFLQIDKLCNIEKSMNIMQKGLYEYMDEVELDDDFNIEALEIDEDEIDREIELKNNTLNKIVERAFLIWLYPNHHLKPSEVKEILRPYFEDEKKSEMLFSKYGEYLRECVEIRESYNNERKNLKAQINKK